VSVERTGHINLCTQKPRLGVVLGTFKTRTIGKITTRYITIDKLTMVQQQGEREGEKRKMSSGQCSCVPVLRRVPWPAIRIAR
jgi:hypothetical protein